MNKKNTTMLKNMFIDLIYSESKLEHINITRLQTQSIIEGIPIIEISKEDMQVIVNLKNAWQWILNYHNVPFNLKISNKINSFVAYNESIDWGSLRTGNTFINGINFQPSIPNSNDIQEYIKTLTNKKINTTEKALNWMYYAMRSQLYWDGNKRTAILSANYILLQHNIGILLISEKLLAEWNKLLSTFYETGNNTKIINWTIDNCIFKYINVSDISHQLKSKNKF